jgi:hypothetical protein
LGRLEGLEDEQAAYDRCLQSALENGQLASAIQGSNDSRVCVFVFDLDDQCLDADKSCPNMGGAFCLENSKLSLDNLGYILVIDDVYYPYLRPFYLKSELINQDNFDPMLCQAIKLIQDTDTSTLDCALIDETYGRDNTEYTLEEFKTI